MSRWETLELFLFDNDMNNKSFTSVELAEWMEVEAPEASAYIQAYLDAQRDPDKRTIFALHRTGRTSGAVWHVGVRQRDVHSLNRQAADDVRCAFQRTVFPTMHRCGVLNPRTRRVVETGITAMNAWVDHLVAMVEGDGSDGST